jgi:hypothetical protein
MHNAGTGRLTARLLVVRSGRVSTRLRDARSPSGAAVTGAEVYGRCFPVEVEGSSSNCRIPVEATAYELGSGAFAGAASAAAPAS